MVFIQTSDTLTAASFFAAHSATTPEQSPKQSVNSSPDTVPASNRSPENLVTHALKLPPLPAERPLLMVGHGTRNPKGRQDLIDFGNIYHR